jgi:hypothetical protein
MRVYSVMLPARDGAQAPGAAEAARLIGDGFNWWALLFGPLWLLWHRLWRWLVIVVAVLAVAAALSPLVEALASLAVSLLLGLEGHNLLRAGLERRGWREAAVIVARDRDEAEMRLAALLAAGGGRRPAMAQGGGTDADEGAAPAAAPGAAGA